MLALWRHLTRHELDDWRDDSIAAAAALLNQAATDIVVKLDGELDAADWRDHLVSPADFLAKHIGPKVRETAAPIVGLIVEDANAALARIKPHHAVWNDMPGQHAVTNGAWEGWGDVAVAAGPLAGGAAVAAALPSLAVTTTTSFFGLVTLTAISWPTVLVGGAVAGAALGTGLLQTAQVRDKAKARLRRKMQALVVRMLIKGPADDPSILEQLSALFTRTAAEARAL